MRKQYILIDVSVAFPCRQSSEDSQNAKIWDIPPFDTLKILDYYFDPVTKKEYQSVYAAESRDIRQRLEPKVHLNILEKIKQHQFKIILLINDYSALFSQQNNPFFKFYMREYFEGIFCLDKRGYLNENDNSTLKSWQHAFKDKSPMFIQDLSLTEEGEIAFPLNKKLFSNKHLVSCIHTSTISKSITNQFNGVSINITKMLANQSNTDIETFLLKPLPTLLQLKLRSPSSGSANLQAKALPRPRSKTSLGKTSDFLFLSPSFLN